MGRLNTLSTAFATSVGIGAGAARSYHRWPAYCGQKSKLRFLKDPQTAPARLPVLCTVAGAATSSPLQQAAEDVRDISKLSFVFYGGSTFVLEYSTPLLDKPVRILVDPWLEGDLVFGNVPAFFRGKKHLAAKPLSNFGDFDCVVITQHLPDHCHQPTLSRLPRSMPVIAPTCAVGILRTLQYENIFALDFNDSIQPLQGDLRSDIRITAGRGSVVGPPWSKPQLAYLFEFPSGLGTSTNENNASIRVYHETHGNHDATFLRTITSNNQTLDAVISPVVSTDLPILFNYNVVRGVRELVDLCRQTQPRACIPFDNSPSSATGILANFIKSSGGFDELEGQLQEDPELRGIRLIRPETETALEIARRPSSLSQE